MELAHAISFITDLIALPTMGDVAFLGGLLFVTVGVKIRGKKGLLGTHSRVRRPS